MRARSTRFVLTVGAALCVTAHADEPAPPVDLASRSIEELMRIQVATVSSASKFDQKVTRAPASVTLVTAEDIARFGYRTLADALRGVRGLYVSDDRNYTYVGIRGFLRPGDYNSRVLLLVDGRRMNDNLYDGAYFGRDGLPSIDIIERIEVVRGPSSSIYGSSAFFGVVNVVTRGAAGLQGTRVSAATGTYNTRDISFSVGDTLASGTDVAISGSYYTSDGKGRIYFPELDPAVSSDPRASDGGVALNRDGEESRGFTASLRHGGLTLSASWLEREKDVPTASFETRFNADEYTRDARGYIDARYEYFFNQDLALNARVSLDRYHYDGDYPMPDEPIARDEATGVWVNTEWQLSYELPDGDTILAGIDVRNSLDQEQLSFDDTSPRLYDVRDRRSESNYGLYAQGEFTLAPKVLLNAGVRYDRYLDSFGGTLNPRIGLIVSATARTALKLLYGSAFRAPSVYERFYYPPPAGMDALDPERIHTYELVLEQYLDNATRLNVSAYQYTVYGLITQQADRDGNIYYDNATEVRARGVEMELERRFEHGALARLSYAYQDTKDIQTREELTSSPHHVAKLHAYLPLPYSFGTALEMQYQSAVRTLLQQHAGGFVLGNWHLSRTFTAPNLTLSASIFNVLDRRYGYPGAEDHVQNLIELNGRTFTVRASVRF